MAALLGAHMQIVRMMYSCIRSGMRRSIVRCYRQYRPGGIDSIYNWAVTLTELANQVSSVSSSLLSESTTQYDLPGTDRSLLKHNSHVAPVSCPLLKSDPSFSLAELRMDVQSEPTQEAYSPSMAASPRVVFSPYLPAHPAPCAELQPSSGRNRNPSTALPLA
jgi:hypothetical protein